MPVVAVVAHAGKTFGGGLAELRRVLADSGYRDPIWREVAKSRKAPEQIRRVLADGAELVFAWGGDGMVQRCVHALAESDAALAILPAGTANLLARNLKIPRDVAEAVRVGLHGARLRLDTGAVNGERFAVMAGAGLDASMIDDADGRLKHRFGRAAYVYAAARNLNGRRVSATVKVDGQPFFKGKISCVLIGNVGKILGGVEVFPAARPDDGLLEVGVATARGPVQWARTLGCLATGNVARSPFVHLTRGKRVKLSFDKPVRYELDGGARSRAARLDIKVHPSSVTVCVPEPRQVLRQRASSQE
ncbi:MAG TPA: diacylglycerol kinase family protein [Streptosporangiaceae bacterium]|nr:diacylglycerol kinase family protein [Streptosporangiaceae bacterium]